MSMCNYLENKILDYIFSRTSYIVPTILYLGVSTTAVQEDGTGITEPTDSVYERLTITNNATNFPAAVDSIKQNAVRFDFEVATESWGTITHFFISDAITGGNILIYGTLTVSKVIDIDDQLILPVNALSISLD